MNQRIKNILLGLVILGLVVLAVLGPQFLPQFSKLHNVFDSPLNMGLVAVLVILIAIFDVRVGVAFAFLVLMFAVYLMDEKNTRKIENFFASVKIVEGKQEFAPNRMTSIPVTPIESFNNPTTSTSAVSTGVNLNMNNMPNNNNTTTTTTSNMFSTTTTTTSGTTTTTSGTTNATVFPTKSKSTTTTTLPIMMHADAILKAGANTAINKPPACATPQQYDFLTQQAPGDFRINGYDVAGCRYDLASRPQNLTIYGPPLSWCATYDQQQAAKCGTLFYPLNG